MSEYYNIEYIIKNYQEIRNEIKIKAQIILKILIKKESEIYNADNKGLLLVKEKYILF